MRLATEEELLGVMWGSASRVGRQEEKTGSYRGPGGVRARNVCQGDNSNWNRSKWIHENRWWRFPGIAWWEVIKKYDGEGGKLKGPAGALQFHLANTGIREREGHRKTYTLDQEDEYVYLLVKWGGGSHKPMLIIDPRHKVGKWENNVLKANPEEKILLLKKGMKIDRQKKHYMKKQK